jgi:hypothetical protein
VAYVHAGQAFYLLHNNKTHPARAATRRATQR